MINVQSLSDCRILDLRTVGNWNATLDGDFNSLEYSRVEVLILPDTIKKVVNTGDGFTGLKELIAPGLIKIYNSFNNSPNLKTIKLYNDLNKKVAVFIDYSFKNTLYNTLHVQQCLRVMGSFNLTLGEPCVGYWRGILEVKTSSTHIPLLCKMLTLAVKNKETPNFNLQFPSTVRYIVLDNPEHYKTSLARNFLNYLCNLKYVFIPKGVTVDLCENFILSGTCYKGTTFLYEDGAIIKNAEVSFSEIRRVKDVNEARDIILRDISEESKIAISYLTKSAALHIPIQKDEVHPSFIPINKILEQYNENMGVGFTDRRPQLTCVMNFLDTFTFRVKHRPTKHQIWSSFYSWVLEGEQGQPDQYVEIKGIASKNRGAFDLFSINIDRKEVDVRTIVDYGSSNMGGLELKVGDKIALMPLADNWLEVDSDYRTKLYATIGGHPIDSKLNARLIRKLRTTKIVYMEYADGTNPIDIPDSECEALVRGVVRDTNILKQDLSAVTLENIAQIWHIYDYSNGNIIVFKVTIRSCKYFLNSFRLKILKSFLPVFVNRGEEDKVDSLGDVIKPARLEVIDVLNILDWRKKYSKQYKDLMYNLRKLFRLDYPNLVEEE